MKTKAIFPLGNENKHLAIENKRIIFNNYSEKIDVTLTILSACQEWFKENNFHITKSTIAEKKQALIFTNDGEIIDYVEDFYDIKTADFSSVESDAEKEWLKSLLKKNNVTQCNEYD
ncbi:TPA: hypothetical protein ACHVCR_001547 [Streptococcus suis]|nr:hypothetical protein [Enterococcus faecalis]